MSSAAQHRLDTDREGERVNEWSWRWSFVLCSELSDGETAGRDGETEDGRNNTKVAQWRKYQAAVARKKERKRQK